MTHGTARRQHELRHMSMRDFAMWGLQDVAFVKRVDGEDGASWEIFAADGSHVGTAPNRDLAFAAVRQHDLEPYSVH